MKQEDEYLTISDIVNEYNGKVKYSTVGKYVKAGIIKGEIEFGKWLVKRSDLEAYRNRSTNNNECSAPIKKPRLNNLAVHVSKSDIYNEVMANFNNK